MWDLKLNADLAQLHVCLVGIAHSKVVYYNLEQLAQSIQFYYQLLQSF